MRVMSEDTKTTMFYTSYAHEEVVVRSFGLIDDDFVL